MKIEIKKDKKARIKDLVIGVIALLVFTYTLDFFKIPLLSAFAPFIFALFICHYILSYTQSVHTYTFGEEILIIDRKTGYKETNLFNIEYEDIEYISFENEKAGIFVAGRFDKIFIIMKTKNQKKKIRIHKNDEIKQAFENAGVTVK